MFNLIKEAVLFAMIAATFLIVSSTLVNSAKAADITCAKIKSTHKTGYPVSKDAKKLASYLQVKKCSKSFVTAVESMGESINFVAADQSLLNQLRAEKVERMKEKIKGFSF